MKLEIGQRVHHPVLGLDGEVVGLETLPTYDGLVPHGGVKVRVRFDSKKKNSEFIRVDWQPAVSQVAQVEELIAPRRKPPRPQAPRPQAARPQAASLKAPRPQPPRRRVEGYLPPLPPSEPAVPATQERPVYDGHGKFIGMSVWDGRSSISLLRNGPVSSWDRPRDGRASSSPSWLCSQRGQRP